MKGEVRLLSEYGHMLRTLKKLKKGHGNDPKLVIGIDDAHYLSQKNTMLFRPSSVLCRVINAYSRSGNGSIWVAFASTTSKVADFSAPQPIRKYLVDIAC